VRLRLEFTVERALPSWNVFYAGRHWARRAAMVRQWRWLVREALGLRRPDPPLRFPVTVQVLVGKRTHALDADNPCAKLVIDGLKGLVLPDDDGRYLAWAVTGSRKAERNFTRVRIYERSRA